MCLFIMFFTKNFKPYTLYILRQEKLSYLRQALYIFNNNNFSFRRLLHRLQSGVFLFLVLIYATLFVIRISILYVNVQN